MQMHSPNCEDGTWILAMFEMWAKQRVKARSCFKNITRFDLVLRASCWAAPRVLLQQSWVVLWLSFV